jgi:dolichyl-diphosphooligosaccharide--protein glycosyltransferase
MPASWGVNMSLNDVCCFVPVWFGISGTVFLALLSSECSKSWTAGAAAALVMSVVPAHVMRCHGGGYDNESIAITAMCMTFFFWCRALRADPQAKDGTATRDSNIFGVLAGFAYIYMVMAWGGFIFVINLVAVHAAALCVIGRFSSKLHRAYTLFYVIGTIGAMRVPVVGMSPLKSLEQLSGMAVFVGLQWLQVCEVYRRKHKLSVFQTFLLRLKLLAAVVVGVALVVALLTGFGTDWSYFGPLSSRIRGLFVKHTRTGNPLVDSVAEHQPANEQAYKQYLLNAYDYAPAGFYMSLAQVVWGVLSGTSDGTLFIGCYACAAFYFSSKMSRLIILMGPIASACAGIGIGLVFDQLIFNAIGSLIMPIFKAPEDKGGSSESKVADGDEPGEEEDEDADAKLQKEFNEAIEKGKAEDPTPASETIKHPTQVDELLAMLNVPVQKMLAELKKLWAMLMKLYNSPPACVARICIGVYCVQQLKPVWDDFYKQSDMMADGLSQPSIMFKASL